MAAKSLLSSLARSLEGKVALITGGASGIGESTARLFCSRGAKVVIADVHEHLGRNVCEQIIDDGGVASFIRCDVTNEPNIIDAVDFAVSSHGKLDIMFNNAGIIDEPQPSILNNTKEAFERVLAVNLTGVFLGTKHAARVMIPNKSGSIVNTGSTGSVVAASGSHAYTSAKHGVVGLTKNAAVELGQFGVRVNCVSPYGAATPLTEGFTGLKGEELEKALAAVANLKGVYMKTEDVAEAVAFLSSDAARYVSGHNLVVDGGFTVTNPSLGMFRYPEATD